MPLSMPLIKRCTLRTSLSPLTTAMAASLFCASTMAADVAHITLENGAKVRLKEDFTWEYIITEAQHTAAIPAEVTSVAPVATTAIASTAVAANTSSSAASVAPTASSANTASSATVSAVSVKDSLTPQAMSQPELLGATAKDGIKVSFADAQWQDDRVALIFDLTSTSNEHVTLVEVEASFYADDGRLLKKETLDVWEAIFRMPETYLRRGEQRQSSKIWIEGLDKSQWQKQLMSLKITDINSR